MAKYIDVPCGCGRTLRATHERAGSAIRCWDCREEVAVPRAQLSGRLVCELLGSVRYSFNIPRFAQLLLVGVVMAGLLALGRVGPWLVAAAAVSYLVLGRRTVAWTLGLARVALRNHPLATMGCALAVLPTLGMIEVATIGLAREQGWFRYVVLDLSSRASAARVLGHRADIGMIDLTSISDADLFRIYAGGLRRGRLLAVAIPASLWRGTADRLNSGYGYANMFEWQATVEPGNYLVFRAGATALIGALVCMVLGLWRRWVFLIGTVDQRHLALANAEPRRGPRTHLPAIILSPLGAR